MYVCTTNKLIVQMPFFIIFFYNKIDLKLNLFISSDDEGFAGTKDLRETCLFSTCDTVHKHAGGYYNNICTKLTSLCTTVHNS